MRRHAKAQSAGSTQGQGEATSGASGSGAPSANWARALVAFAATAGLAVSLVAVVTPTAVALPPCPNEALRVENNSTELPDCRAFEQVSPPGGGEVYVPSGQRGVRDIATQRRFRAAADGHAVTFLADPSVGEPGNGATGSGFGNQYFATRTANGWKTSNIAVPDTISLETLYKSFTGDLSLGIVYAPKNERQLAPDAVPSCRNMYARSTGDGEYRPFFTQTQTPGFCGFEEEPVFAGASADDSHLLFQTAAALTPDAEEAPGEGQDNLYQSFDGQLSLINILPHGEPDPNAAFGGLPNHETSTPGFSLSHVISDDGSRLFWTDLNTGIVYLRENPTASVECTLSGEPGKACTVPVSTGPARFWTASNDGRYAYYTEAEELWRFDAQTETREALAGPGSAVKGVIGVNETGEDGAYLYFVAAGKLTPDAESLTCEMEEKEEAGILAVGKGCNLYVLHKGEPVKLIGKLAPFDGEGQIDDEGHRGGDWYPGLGYRVADLTPDGTHLAFTSQQPLTAYDNSFFNETSGLTERVKEAYVYDATANGGDGKLSCASCDPTGAPPVAAGPAEVPITYDGTSTTRWIDDDGTEVFFDSGQPLLPQDTNDHQDVYEWTAEGTDGCLQSGGCLSLLSGGTVANNSYLIEASASGSDVFLISRAQLAPSDRDEKMDLYDVRVSGGFPVPSSTPGCESGEACGGEGTRGPTAQSPGSATFSGAENPPPSVKCRKSFVKKRGTCVKRRHRARHRGHAHKRATSDNRGGVK